MSGDLSLNIRKQKAPGSDNPREFNHCVSTHLALGWDGFASGWVGVGVGGGSDTISQPRGFVID